MENGGKMNDPCAEVATISRDNAKKEKSSCLGYPARQNSP
jgi:hypothetical protein